MARERVHTRRARSEAPNPPAPESEVLAKISRPRLHGALVRPRLFDRIGALRKHSVVWISGPPGAGKTTLVASYLDSHRMSGIWYQLDAGDADVSTFFLYLNQAATPIASGQPDLPLFTPEYLPDLPGFGRRYFRELFARMPRDSVLVLDNFQEVAKDSLFHQAIHAAIQEVPRHRNLIVISRAEPGQDYTRALAVGAIAQLRWTELRLAFDETRAIACAREPLADHAIEALHTRSDGWAAGLVLMLERADAGVSQTERIGLASREAVFEYFASILFDHLAPVAQRSLMLCALVPTLTAHAATEISADPTAERLLEDLYRRQLFVQRIGAFKAIYRFHALFREFLNAKARQTLAEHELDSASLRAADVAEAEGDIEQAYELLAQARQSELAMRTIVNHAPRLFAEGRWRTILDWISRLPTDSAGNNPWIDYWAGVSQFQFNQELSRGTLARAYGRFEAADDKLGQMLSAASILAGYYFEYSKWDSAEPWIIRLGQLLESRPAFPSRNLEMTVHSAMLYGIAIRRPDHPLLPTCIERTVGLIESEQDTNARMLAGLAITGPVVCMLGAFDLFYRVRSMLLPLLERRNLTELNRAAWHMTNGTKLCLHAEHDEAYSELERGAALSRQFNLHQIEVLCHFFTAMHAASYLDVARTRLAMDALQSVVNPLRPLERAHQLWGEGMYETVAGNHAAAIAHHERALRAVEAIGGAAHRLIGLLLYSAPLVLAGRIADAIAVAEDGLRYATSTKLHTWDATFVLILAWCRHELGDDAQAGQLLDKAIEVGEDGTFRYFRWLLQGSRKMLAEALRRGIRSDSARSIVQRFRYTCPDPFLDNWPWPVKVLTLGAFSVEIQGEPLSYGRKMPKRPLSLLQCLIALGGHAVAEHKLADALWPDADGDEASQRLALTLHRLRQLLGDSEAIRVSGGRVSLDPDRVWVDALRVLQASDRKQGRPPAALDMALERGDFLQDQPEEPWTLFMRSKLRALRERAIPQAEASNDRSAGRQTEREELKASNLK